MPKYLVTITGEAIEYSFGGSLPYPIKEEKRFDAIDDIQAKEMEERYKREVAKDLLHPRNIKSSLEQINSVL